jgi:hypothetical protein
LYITKPQRDGSYIYVDLGWEIIISSALSMWHGNITLCCFPVAFVYRFILLSNLSDFSSFKTHMGEQSSSRVNFSIIILLI